MLREREPKRRHLLPPADFSQIKSKSFRESTRARVQGNRVSDNWQGIFFPRVPFSHPPPIKGKTKHRTLFFAFEDYAHSKRKGGVGKHGDIYFIRSIRRRRGGQRFATRSMDISSPLFSYLPPPNLSQNRSNKNIKERNGRSRSRRGREIEEGLQVGRAKLNVHEEVLRDVSYRGAFSFFFVSFEQYSNESSKNNTSR